MRGSYTGRGRGRRRRLKGTEASRVGSSRAVQSSGRRDHSSGNSGIRVSWTAGAPVDWTSSRKAVMYFSATSARLMAR
jgi:hypothetical protein